MSRNCTSVAIVLGLIVFLVALEARRPIDADGSSRRRQAEQTPATESAPNSKPSVPPVDVPLLGDDILATVKNIRAAEAKVRQAMQQKMPHDWKDVPLRELVTELSQFAGISVVLDELALDEAEIDVETVVSGKVTGVTIETALNRVLELQELTWLIQEETLQITAEFIADEHRFARVYNLRPLRLLLDANKNRQQLVHRRKQRGGLFQIRDAQAPPSVPHVVDSWKRTQFQFGADWGIIGGKWKRISKQSFPVEGGWSWDALFEAFSETYLLSGAGFDFSSGEFDSIAPLVQGDLLAVWCSQQVHERLEPLLRAWQAILGEQHPRAMIPIVPTTYPIDQDAAIHRTLSTTVALEYKQLPLSDVIADLEKQMQTVILVDEIALDEEGLSLDEPITISVRSLTRQSALKTMLEPLGLAIIVRHGAIEVTNVIAAQSEISMMVYDVLDLVTPGGDMYAFMEMVKDVTSGLWVPGGDYGYVSAPFTGVLTVECPFYVHQEIAELLATMRLHNDRNIQGPQPMPTEPDKHAVTIQFYALPAPAVAQELMAVILQFVAPETWDAEALYMIWQVHDRLVIRQTNAVHKQIEDFLFAYESVRFNSPAVR